LLIIQKKSPHDVTAVSKEPTIAFILNVDGCWRGLAPFFRS